MADDDERGIVKWHIRREISVGDIVLAVSVLVSIGVPLIYWGSGIERRVSVLEVMAATSVTQQQRIDAEQDQTLRDSVGRIESAIHDIQSYLLAHNATHSP